MKNSDPSNYDRHQAYSICGVCLAKVYLEPDERSWWHYVSDVYDISNQKKIKSTCVGKLTYRGEETKFAWPAPLPPLHTLP